MEASRVTRDGGMEASRVTRTQTAGHAACVKGDAVRGKVQELTTLAVMIAFSIAELRAPGFALYELEYLAMRAEPHRKVPLWRLHEPDLYVQARVSAECARTWACGRAIRTNTFACTIVQSACSLAHGRACRRRTSPPS